MFDHHYKVEIFNFIVLSVIRHCLTRTFPVERNLAGALVPLNLPIDTLLPPF